MKKILGFLLLTIGLLSFSQSINSKKEERSGILKIYNWADYIDEKLLSEFQVWYKEQTGQDIRVIYQLFDINEVMLTKIEKGREDYDVVCPSDYIIERMMKKDLLLPINRDFGHTPDYTINVSNFAIEQFNKLSTNDKLASDYTVGYMWGTTGLLYNTEYVTKEDISTWGAIWNPLFKDKILMKDAFRDVYGSVMQYVRQDELAQGLATRHEIINDASDKAIKLFEDTIKAAKNNISGWEVDFGKERMVQGKAWINVTWSGDATWAMEEVGDAVSLDYTVPLEGSTFWFDGWVVPKYAKNPKAAMYFINFLCMSHNAIRNMAATGYVSVIGTPEVLESQLDSTIEKRVDLSYFFGDSAYSVQVNGIRYPDKSVIQRCDLMRDCGERVEAMIDMWSRVKGDSLNIITLIIIGIVITFIITWFILKKRKKNKKRNRIKKPITF